MAFIDSPDFTEILLMHMARSPRVIDEIRRLGVTPDDFVTNDLTGIEAHRVLARIILEAGQCPISDTLLSGQLEYAIQSGQLANVKPGQHQAMLSLILGQRQLDDEFVIAKIAPWLKKRRSDKAVALHGTDPDTLLCTLGQIDSDISSVTGDVGEVVFSPFEDVIYTPQTDIIPTGFRLFDNATDGGLARGNIGCVFGWSGGGKTAFALFLARCMTLNGYHVNFWTAELSVQEIAWRVYSAALNIPYGDLRANRGGNMIDSINREMGNVSADTKKSLARMHIIDARNHRVTAREMYDRKVKIFKRFGYWADVDIFDQLGYLQSDLTAKDAQPWEQLKQKALDLDQFSHKTYRDEESGAEFRHYLLTLHQLTGKPSKAPEYNNISGFKNLVESFDEAFSIASDKDDRKAFTLASMKTRHYSPFTMEIEGDLQFMRFVNQQDYSSGYEKHSFKGNPSAAVPNHALRSAGGKPANKPK